jgi:hypothetical protein
MYVSWFNVYEFHILHSRVTPDSVLLFEIRDSPTWRAKSLYLCTINSTRTDLPSNRHHGGMKPATNHLSYTSVWLIIFLPAEQRSSTDAGVMFHCTLRTRIVSSLQLSPVPSVGLPVRHSSGHVRLLQQYPCRQHRVCESRCSSVSTVTGTFVFHSQSGRDFYLHHVQRVPRYRSRGPGFSER